MRLYSSVQLAASLIHDLPPDIHQANCVDKVNAGPDKVRAAYDVLNCQVELLLECRSFQGADQGAER